MKRDDSSELDLGELATFAAFARSMNLTRAARERNLSQPAVHAQLRRLSEALGAPLYVREGRRLVLTPEGRRTLAFAQEAREGAEALLRDVRGAPGARPVVLAAGEGALRYLLAPAIERAIRVGRSGEPGLGAPLRLLTRDRGGTLEALASGEAHLGVTVLASAGEAATLGLSVEPLRDVSALLVARRDDPLVARRRAPSLQDLDGARLVLPPSGQPQREALDLALAQAGARVVVVVEARGWELALHFAQAGLGAAIVSGFCRLPRGLVGRPLRDLPLARYSLLHRPGSLGRGPVAALRKLVLEAASAGRKAQAASGVGSA